MKTLFLKKQILPLLTILLLTIPPVSFANSQSILYQISQTDNPLILKATMTLPKALSKKEQILALRGSNLGIQSQVKNVNCNGKTVQTDPNGSWPIPADCDNITWDIKLLPSLPGIDQQASARIEENPSWILLSEFSSIPRIESEKYDSLIEFSPSMSEMLVGNFSQEGKNRWFMPGVKEAPVFFIFGLQPFRTETDLNISLAYITDNKAFQEELGAFFPQHLAGISYMQSLFESPPDKLPLKQLVVWIASTNMKGMGGAAGYGLFLANYPIAEGKIVEGRLIWSFMVAFHEQFHLLYKPASSQPTWAIESLAHYYGIKTMGKVGFEEALLAPIKAAFLQREKEHAMGLKEINRRYVQESDMSLYGLFYNQGASFWFELDTLIRAQTDNQKSLDTFVAALAKMKFGEDFSLPPDFLLLLKKNHIKGYEPLVKKYL